VPMSKVRHVFMSPGPIFEVDTDEPDYFRGARAMYAGGFRPGDVVYNTFSYHLTPAGIMMESALKALGCATVPGGVGNTELQLDAIAGIRPKGYVGTPSFLKILIEKAAETAKDISSLKHAFVGAEALPPSLRQMFIDQGMTCLQSYGTADLGTIAYESEAPDGSILGMTVDEGVIVEIVRPGTGDPLPEGDVGEVVVTTFNRAYPLIRFGTGDMSAVLAGVSPCGRTNIRIKGWMGRADQTTKVKGMFVHPAQVAEIAKRHPELARVRLVVSREAEQDAMTLHAETAAADAGLADALGATLASVTKLRGAVKLVPPGSLPNDGKVIADERPVG